MDCEHMLQLINHYMDGGLSQWRNKAVDRHMDDCPPCAQHLTAHVYVRQVVASKCSEDAPEALRIRITEAISVITLDTAPLDLG
jgi:mycothiol system anti-sigma-R factor